MAVTRRLFMGGFTAGAVTVAVGATGGEAAAAETAGTVTPFAGEVHADRFTTDSAGNSAFLKTTSATEHTATLYQAGTSGTGVALNVVSDNPGTSAMYLSGTETGRGTLKIAHRGYTDASDANAAALSIDLQTPGATDPAKPGTAAQGIYVTATHGPTSGALLVLRNNAGLDDLTVKGTGLIGIGIDRGATPRAQVHIVQRTTKPGLLVDGTVEIGNTATPPTGTVSSAGGGTLYAQNGELWWRGAAGTRTRLAPA
ncbi:hyaluronoglucosaminidase [Streptomyces sp. NPDC057411]|uniref:hyaluronoglucosaminidase n=1 Tax=unclassified Streptomyces TaxID=2593676 RepID=UPI0036388EB2